MSRRGHPWIAFLVVIGSELVPRAAAAEIALKWDCYLPGAAVDCVVLANGLTAKVPFLKVVPDRRTADVVVTLTSLPAENGVRIKIDLVGKPVDGYATHVDTTDKIPNSIDSATATERVLTKLERGLDDFLDQKIASAVEDGELVIRVVDPVQQPFAGRPEQAAKAWYVAPAVGAYFSSVQGVGINASGSASLYFNYSERSWRVQQSIGGNYSRQSQPVTGTDQTASISFIGGNASNVLGWSLTPERRLNAGVLISGEKNPQANFRARANASVGLEFDLIPRLTVNQKNFGARCAIGPEFQHYDAVNVQGIDQQIVGRQFCELFLSWHFALVDVWASVGETTVLQDFAYRSLAANLSATWRVTDDVTVSPWMNVQQINKALNEAAPNDVVYTDPRQVIEASMRAAVQQGYTAPFGIQTGLAIRYLFGNGSLSVEDQRWKNVSNLR